MCDCEPFQSCEECYKPTHAKPGKKAKSTKIWNKKARLHDIKVPENKNCKHCGELTGTEAMRHAESSRVKFLVGGGVTGAKINDNLTALLCFDCDAKLSAKPDKRDKLKCLLHDLDWCIAIIKTHLL